MSPLNTSRGERVKTGRNTEAKSKEERDDKVTQEVGEGHQQLSHAHAPQRHPWLALVQWLLHRAPERPLMLCLHWQWTLKSDSRRFVSLG